MGIETRAELFEALAQGRFDDLLGWPESEWLDFKEMPHDLRTKKGQRDLVADVATFANHVGGVIVSGVQAPRREDNQREEATAVVGATRGSVDEDRIHALVRAHVFPLLHVDIRWYRERDGDVWLVALVVEPQGEERKPFLVDRVVVGEAEKDIPHAVGWPVRHGTGTHWESADRIQQLVAAGLRRGAMTPPGGGESFNSVVDEATSHFSIIEDLEEWRPWASYYVQALPSDGPRRFVDFYGELIESARQWEGIRVNGFDLELNGNPLLPQGSGRLLAADYRRAVLIARSGVVTAAAGGSREMLGWANHQNASDAELAFVEVNPFVIVEFTAELIRLAYEFIGPRLDQPPMWTFRAVGHHVKGGGGRAGLRLRPRPRRFPSPDRLHEPIADEFVVEVPGTGDMWADAHQLLVAVYGEGWGAPASSIPFAQEGRVNLELMDASA